MFNWLTTAVAATDKKIRQKIAQAIRSHYADPKPSIRKVTLEWTDKNVASMLSYAALFTHTAENFASEDKGSQLTDEERASLHLKATLTHAFRDDIDVNPFVTNHITLLNNINIVLQDAFVDSDEALDFEDFFLRFKDRIDDYLATCEDWFNTMNFTSIEDFNSRKTTRDIWYATHYPTQPHRDDHNHDHVQEQEHRDALANVVNSLAHNQLPDEITIAILTPTLGSAGFRNFNNLGYNMYLHFMPFKWILTHRDAIWEKRMQSKFEDEDKFYEPNDIDDSELNDLEGEEFKSLDDYGFWTPEDPTTGRPPMDENSEASTRRNKRKAKKEKQKEDNNPKKGQTNPEGSGTQTPPASQQPPTPDDTNYTPNWILARQVKYQIQSIKSKVPFPDHFDHMTHFNVTNETPQDVPISKVTNRDIKVFKGTSLLDGFYILTFTRKSRKPIFNPVI